MNYATVVFSIFIAMFYLGYFLSLHFEHSIFIGYHVSLVGTGILIDYRYCNSASDDGRFLKLQAVVRMTCSKISAASNLPD